MFATVAIHMRHQAAASPSAGTNFAELELRGAWGSV